MRTLDELMEDSPTYKITPLPAAWCAARRAEIEACLACDAERPVRQTRTYLIDLLAQLKQAEAQARATLPPAMGEAGQDPLLELTPELLADLQNKAHSVLDLRGTLYGQLLTERTPIIGYGRKLQGSYPDFIAVASPQAVYALTVAVAKLRRQLATAEAEKQEQWAYANDFREMLDASQADLAAARADVAGLLQEWMETSAPEPMQYDDTLAFVRAEECHERYFRLKAASYAVPWPLAQAGAGIIPKGGQDNG